MTVKDDLKEEKKPILEEENSDWGEEVGFEEEDDLYEEDWDDEEDWDGDDLYEGDDWE